MKFQTVRFVLAAVVTLLLATPVFAQVAQPATTVQQTGTHQDAATRCDSQAGTGTQTLTLLNPGPGLADYITLLILNGELTAAVTPASPVAFTTTNINGTSPTFGSAELLAGAQGKVVGPGVIVFNPPLKANTNTAPTIVHAGITNESTRMTACYYAAQ